MGIKRAGDRRPSRSRRSSLYTSNIIRADSSPRRAPASATLAAIARAGARPRRRNPQRVQRNLRDHFRPLSDLTQRLATGGMFYRDSFRVRALRPPVPRERRPPSVWRLEPSARIIIFGFSTEVGGLHVVTRTVTCNRQRRRHLGASPTNVWCNKEYPCFFNH